MRIAFRPSVIALALAMAGCTRGSPSGELFVGPIAGYPGNARRAPAKTSRR